jgi:hypothetical protein
MPSYRPQYSVVAAPPALAIGMVCSECGALVPESERSIHDQWHEWLNAWVAKLAAPEITEELARGILRRMLEMQQEEEG